MAIGSSRKVSATSKRPNTRKQMKLSSSSSSSFPSGMLKILPLVLLVGLLAWSYQAIQPPPPRVCGSPNGPPITSSRIKLKDGRHMAYIESGVSKDKANHKIIFIHGLYSCRYDVLPVSSEVLKELGVYLLSFDRPGYGESDPNPKMTEKSTALDIEELAEQLELGSKFYVIGHSLGGKAVWSCLKFIAHRLAGAALLAPVSNYWWPNFPANISKETYYQQLVRDQWSLRVIHYAPWLTYRWNIQKWFLSSSVIPPSFEIFSNQDKLVLPQLSARNAYEAQITQQGVFESLHRDLIVGFGSWQFDPMDLDDPFPEGEGSVHLWHGVDDLMVPITLSRYITQKLPWIRYHELDAGHLFPIADGMGDIIVKALLLGDS